jgi:hypothetical protein
MDIKIEDYLEKLKAHKLELETIKPVFKPQYTNKCRHQALRVIAEHSNVFEIEIHPNIIDELIVKERLKRATDFVNSKLAVLTAASLADLQLEVQAIMTQQEIEAVERRMAEMVKPSPVEIVNDSSVEIVADKKGKKK